ncbi:MAG: hypothetical protein ACI8W3_003055 [Myxococcota bacterium]|jgi:hypothetical protein
MDRDSFSANPIGVTFAPGNWAQRYEAGTRSKNSSCTALYEVAQVRCSAIREQALESMAE